MSVVARAIGARTSDRWRAWGRREAQRLHGVVDGAPGAVTATFAGVGADDAWTNALRFALGLRDKGTLLGMPVSAGVAGTAADAIRLLAATASNDILAGEEMSTQARAWLDARQLIDSDPATGRSVRLRARVATSRAAPVAARKAADAAPIGRRMSSFSRVTSGRCATPGGRSASGTPRDSTTSRDCSRRAEPRWRRWISSEPARPAGASLSGMPRSGVRHRAGRGRRARSRGTRAVPVTPA